MSRTPSAASASACCWIVAIGSPRLSGAGFAWRALLPKPRPAPWLLSAGCAGCGNRSTICCPVAQIGGDVFGARLLRSAASPAGCRRQRHRSICWRRRRPRSVFTLLGVFFLADRGVAPT